MPDNYPKLLFIYNAKTGLFNKLTDFAHKAISPGTYACSLCALTYGTFTRKREWAAYLQSLPLEVEFRYRDQWEFGNSATAYPLVALQTAEQAVEVLLTASEINRFRDLQQLQLALEQALQRYNL